MTTKRNTTGCIVLCDMMWQGESLAVTLLPVSCATDNTNDDGGGDDGFGDGDEDGANGGGDGGGVEEVEDVVDALERRALQLEHHMTAKEWVGEDMAERLLPFFSSRCVFHLFIFCACSRTGCTCPPIMDCRAVPGASIVCYLVQVCFVSTLDTTPGVHPYFQVFVQMPLVGSAFRLSSRYVT